MTSKLLILERFLPYRIAILAARVGRSFAQRYEKKFSLSVSEWRIIAVLGENSDLSAAEVSNRTGLDKVAVSRAVKNLLTNNRLERHFSSDDRRRSVLSLSSDGRKVYGEVSLLALSYEESILAGLSEEEHEFLDNILNKLNRILPYTVEESSGCDIRNDHLSPTDS
ncbi:MAG: winged helix-turn-helix transcriptional regulator [Gammaproteobacteria bacterium]|nr:winged helix-turn-helix transcriptional regulator [Gammaproteobacteria bacterium]